MQATLATGTYGKSVRLHLVASGAALAVLDHATPAVAIAFSPDNRLMAAVLEDFTVVVWDLLARKCLPTLTGHSAQVTCLAFSTDSRLLATCSEVRRGAQ